MARDLELIDQLHVMRNALTRGDLDLMSRALADPNILGPADNQTLAESMGLSNPFVSWAVNVVADPTIWIAALLARRVPLRAWLGGGIPDRFTGMGLSFGKLSEIFKPVNQAFRGTGIDKRIATGLFRQSHFIRTAAPLMESLESLSDNELIAFVRSREEGVLAGVTDLVKTASARATKFFEDTWPLLSRADDIRGGPRGMGESSTISFGPFRDQTSGKLVEFVPAPRNFAELIPHLPILSSEGTLAIGGVDALTRMAARGKDRLMQALSVDGLGIQRATMKLDDGKTFQGVVELGPWRVDRATDTLRVDMGKFQRMMSGTTGESFFGHLKARKRNVPLFSEQGQRSFVLDARHIMAEYVRGAARNYAWNVPLSETERSVASYLVENPNPIASAAGRIIDRFIPQRLGAEPLMIQIQKAAIESMGGTVESSLLAGTEAWTRPVRLLKFRTPAVAGKLSALDHLTKSLRGHFDESEQLFGNAFSSIATSAENMLGRTDPGRRAMRKLATQFEFMKRDSTNRGISNFLTSYSYHTTLGLNVLSALGNSLQTLLTTMPAIGVSASLQGASDVARRLPRYAREVVQGVRSSPQKVSIRNLPKIAGKAWERTFPELSEFGITVDPRAFDIDPRLLEQTAEGRLGGFFKATEDYGKWLLAPFSAVENMNRSIAFFGTRRAFFQTFKVNPGLTGIPRELLREGQFFDDAAGKLLPNVDQFINLHAASTVSATQFLSGGGTRTILQDQIAPWMRTFWSFPLRLGSFMGESTVRGAMTKAELATASTFERMTGGRNFGVLAKMYLFGSITQSGFRDVLGLDVNRYVGFGPIEFGGPNTVGGIVPIPPVAGAFITTGKALVNREFDRTQAMELPGIGRIPIPKTLVPAGVAFSRLARAVNQFQPDTGGFVDDDGRLMRRAGAYDQIMAGLGIPLEKARRERIQLAQLNVRSDRIRELRRKFALSLIEGDFDQTDKLAQRYEKLFPGMGGLNIESSDLRTYAENSRVPRLARRLQSLGKEQRLQLSAEFLEIAPEMIAPTAPGLNAPTGDLAAALAELQGR